jgi:hypothetical protein
MILTVSAAPLLISSFTTRLPSWPVAPVTNILFINSIFNHFYCKVKVVNILLIKKPEQNKVVNEMHGARSKGQGAWSMGHGTMGREDDGAMGRWKRD